MTLQQIAKLWSVVSAVLLYYALNTWLVSQGGTEIFGVKLVLSSRMPAAMLAILICTLLLMSTSLIGCVYARRAGPCWHERIPVVGFATIDTGSMEGKAYQSAMLVLLSWLPALSLIHFWRVFAAGKVVTTESPPRLASGLWDWSALGSLNDPARICAKLLNQQEIACANGATFFPVLEPALFALLTILTVIVMGLHWRAVFGSRGDRLPASTPDIGSHAGTNLGR